VNPNTSPKVKKEQLNALYRKNPLSKLCSSQIRLHLFGEINAETNKRPPRSFAFPMQKQKIAVFVWRCMYHVNG